MNIAKNIVKFRKKKGWSQRELARKLNVQPPQINRIESGKYPPSLQLTVLLSELFEVSLDHLVNNIEDDFAEVKIENQPLAQRINLINSLDEDEQHVVMKVIDSMLTKNKMAQLIQEGVIAIQ